MHESILGNITLMFFALFFIHLTVLQREILCVGGVGGEGGYSWYCFDFKIFCVGVKHVFMLICLMCKMAG